MCSRYGRRIPINSLADDPLFVVRIVLMDYAFCVNGPPTPAPSTWKMSWKPSLSQNREPSLSNQSKFVPNPEVRWVNKYVSSNQRFRKFKRCDENPENLERTIMENDVDVLVQNSFNITVTWKCTTIGILVVRFLTKFYAREMLPIRISNWFWICFVMFSIKVPNSKLSYFGLSNLLVCSFFVFPQWINMEVYCKFFISMDNLLYSVL